MIHLNRIRCTTFEQFIGVTNFSEVTHFSWANIITSQRILWSSSNDLSFLYGVTEGHEQQDTDGVQVDEVFGALKKSEIFNRTLFVDTK